MNYIYKKKDKTWKIVLNDNIKIQMLIYFSIQYTNKMN